MDLNTLMSIMSRASRGCNNDWMLFDNGLDVVIIEIDLHWAGH